MYLPTSHWSSSSDYDDQIDSDSSVFVSKGKICCGEGVLYLISLVSLDLIYKVVIIYSVIYLLKNGIMATTITIDQPLTWLKKTHFSDALQAAYFLIWSIQPKMKKNQWITKKTITKKTHYEKALHDLEEGKNIITLSDYMNQRWLMR